MSVDREEMAATIHKARWPADRASAATPFEDEDRNGREYCFRIADAVLASLSQSDAQSGVARPSAFLAWARETFGPVALVRGERLLRFVEEAIELAHADGMGRAVLDKVADRVFAREPGAVPKEIGQAQACLETYAENIGLSSDAEAQREWERVQGIPKDEWTRRHTAKQAIGIALPIGRGKDPMSSRLNYGPLDHFGPEDNDPGTAFIIHNVDDTVTIKVRSPGDRVFSEVEMPLDAWLKLRSVGGPDPSPISSTQRTGDK